jgi:hypothetical protein
MSRSTRIFRLIARDLPGVVLCKDMLVVVPTERILRGFLLETTTERDRVYLWKVVTPLYRPMRHVILDYSDRIPETGDDVYIDRAAYEKSAAAIRAIIVGERHLDYLRAIRHPQDFLRHASWIKDGSPMLQRFDHTLTRYLVGDVRESVEALRALSVEVDQLDNRRQEYIGPLVKRAMHEIDTNPMGLTRLLDEWLNQNIETLGLRSARAISDVQEQAGAQRADIVAP